ncbi:hypothetical protein BKA70DRAFT_1429954 [Coprinopsis sp. MPI-PUGE-AT-0042]|nr:hypothetical protein BKA70DRAFT_1429954 [Coprinopsis sp. MPI-PUGE-AT-0042]
MDNTIPPQFDPKDFPLCEDMTSLISTVRDVSQQMKRLEAALPFLSWNVVAIQSQNLVYRERQRQYDLLSGISSGDPVLSGARLVNGEGSIRAELLAADNNDKTDARASQAGASDSHCTCAICVNARNQVSTLTRQASNVVGNANQSGIASDSPSQSDSSFYPPGQVSSDPGRSRSQGMANPPNDLSMSQRREGFYRLPNERCVDLSALQPSQAGPGLSTFNHSGFEKPNPAFSPSSSLASMVTSSDVQQAEIQHDSPMDVSNPSHSHRLDQAAQPWELYQQFPFLQCTHCNLDGAIVPSNDTAGR